MDIKNARNTSQHGIDIKGFVGYVSDEGLKELKIALVDKNGDVLGEEEKFQLRNFAKSAWNLHPK